MKGMTNAQFDVLIKLIVNLIDSSSTKEEASKRVSDLMTTKKEADTVNK